MYNGQVSQNLESPVSPSPIEPTGLEENQRLRLALGYNIVGVLITALLVEIQASLTTILIVTVAAVVMGYCDLTIQDEDEE